MNGFLPSRASIMLDVVFVAMIAVLPVLGWSIYLVRCRQQYGLHKRLQLTLGVVLAVAVTAFEVDMRWFTDWRERAAASNYYDAASDSGAVVTALWIHLFFAVTTAALWIYVITAALRRFPRPARPGQHSTTHRRLAWLAAIDMAMTAITGWTFYVLAFVL